MKSMQILKKDFRQNGSMKNSLALQNVKMQKRSSINVMGNPEGSQN